MHSFGLTASVVVPSVEQEDYAETNGNTKKKSDLEKHIKERHKVVESLQLRRQR